ncbi:MAG: phosphonate ABC transporter ATP-binding protein [Candidatus Kapaibacterium sp.]
MKSILYGALTMSILLTGCSDRREAPPLEQKREIVIGLNPSERSEKTQQNADLLAKLIERKLNMPVKMFVAQDYSGLVEALRAHTIDFAFLAPVSYVHAERIANAVVLLKAERQGSPFYFGCIVVNAESPYRTIEDLQGKQIAWVDPSSASGHLFPKSALIEAHYNPDSLFSKQVFAGGHDAVLLSVINGTIDAGATYANDTLGESGSWTQLENGELKEKVRPIFFSKPIPGDNISTSQYMIENYPDLVENVKEAVATMHLDPEGAEVMRSMYHVDAMVPATSQDYDPVRRAADLLNLDITGKIRENDLEHVEKNQRNTLYSWLLVAATFLFGVGVIAAQVIRRKQREEVEGNQDNHLDESPPIAGAQFSLRNLHVIFTDRNSVKIPALKGISIDIFPGEFLAIIGPSGGGKSTLLRILNRAVEPTDGRIFFREKEVSHIQGTALLKLRRNIGFIFQQFNLVGSISAMQNVLTGRLSTVPVGRSLLGLFPEEDIAYARTLLNEVGLQEKEQSRASDLSGGQQQRVAIARALAQEPEVILADEPTASLDPMLAESILTLLQKINRERGITIVANLHSIELARKYGTRILGLRAGHLLFNGSPKDLTEDEIEKIYEASSSNKAL